MYQRISETAADIETVRLIFDQCTGRAVARLERGDVVTARDVQKNRMMGAQMVRLARGAIDRLCGSVGSGWIFDQHPLSIVFRDAAAGATHRAMNFDALARDYLNGLAQDIAKSV
jgi:two-component flavin-dependent monooxygenase/oxygenase LndZ5